MPPKIRPPHRLAPLFFKRQNAEAQLILYVGWCETRFNVTKGSDYILSYIFSVAETNTMVYAGVAATPFPRCSPPSSSKYRPSVQPPTQCILQTAWTNYTTSPGHFLYHRTPHPKEFAPIKVSGK